MPLAALLIPLIPGMVNAIMNIVDAIKGHGETPAELRTQLESISADLQRVVQKVQDVELPTAGT